MIISVKIRKFSRSRMTKRTSPWNRLAKSSYNVEFRQIPRQSELHVFRDNERSAGHLVHFEWLTVCHVSGAESVNLSSSVGPMGDMWHLIIGGKSKVVG